MKTVLVLFLMLNLSIDLPFDAIDIENMEVTNNGKLVTFLESEGNYYYFYLNNSYYKLVVRNNSFYNVRVMYLITYENQVVRVYKETEIRNLFK
jgi:hypothetical protein